MRRQTGILLLALLLAALTARLVYLDDSARHKRLWEELRVLANLTQRHDRKAARPLHEYALAEAKALSTENPLLAVSIGELAYLDYKDKNYSAAVKGFKSAIAMEHRLLARADRQCDDRLLLSDLCKSNLYLAKALQLDRQYDAAKKAYFATVTSCRDSMLTKPADLLTAQRLLDAFDRYCKLTRDVSELKLVVHQVNTFVQNIPASYLESLTEILDETAMRLNLDTRELKNWQIGSPVVSPEGK